MEKTIQITIASMTFSLTESAYGKLSSYLETLKAHFVADEERDEIMRDIESRIAEKLLHKKHGVIVESDITAIIAEIGEASEFGDEEGEEKTETSSPRKRLYRDMDNAWIAGVCSGLGNYFDIDAFWIRLIFLASLFFGGAGIFVYIILWILIPEAKNAGQKLEMRGRPVDLENIARVVREGVDEVRGSGALSRGARTINNFVVGFFRVLSRIVGCVFVVGSFLATIGLLVGAGIVTTNWNAPYNDFPLRGVVGEPLLIAGLIAGVIAIFIPLLAIFSLGIRLISRKTLFPSVVSFGLIGIWAIAVSALGTIGVKASGEFFEYQRTSPEYREESRTLELPAFQSVSVYEGQVVIKKGPQNVAIEGRAREMDRMNVEVVDGVLTVTEKDDYGKLCIFCDNSDPTIIVTTPDLDSVFVESASATFDNYVDDSLAIELFYGSIRGKFDARTLTMKTDGGSVRGTFTSDTLTIESEDTHFELDGSAKSANITLEQANFNADSFEITDATLSAENSWGEVYVTGNLERTRNAESRIVNTATSSSE